MIDLEETLLADEIDELAHLRPIAEAASAYFLGMRMPEFAAENGGLPKLLRRLRRATMDWERDMAERD